MNGKNGHNVLQHAMEGLGLELAESKLLQHMEEQNVMGISKKRKLVTINLAQFHVNGRIGENGIHVAKHVEVECTLG
jgi:hypothetical protein